MKSNHNKRIYYVYKHIHPETKVVLYVGKGVRGRAWTYDNWQWGNNRAKFRDLKHSKILDKLVLKGYLPCDWVKIIDRNLTQEEALATERFNIDKFKPKYNKRFGRNLCKLSESNLRNIIKLRSKGWTLQRLADKYTVHLQTVWAAINTPGKIYKDMI